jgi:hypothetical protein
MTGRNMERITILSSSIDFYLLHHTTTAISIPNIKFKVIGWIKDLDRPTAPDL